MEIPHQNLDKDTLVAMLKEIVTRDGTDYGVEEQSLEEKVSSALYALEQGKARLLWDAESETCSLHSTDEKV